MIVHLKCVLNTKINISIIARKRGAKKVKTRVNSVVQLHLLKIYVLGMQRVALMISAKHRKERQIIIVKNHSVIKNHIWLNVGAQQTRYLPANTVTAPTVHPRYVLITHTSKVAQKNSARRRKIKIDMGVPM